MAVLVQTMGCSQDERPSDVPATLCSDTRRALQAPGPPRTGVLTKDAV